MPETHKRPCAWLKAQDRRDTTKERLPANPERMVFHGLVIFWHENWSVDRPGIWNVTLEFAWTTEVFLHFFFKKAQLMQCIELESSWAAPLFLVRCSMLVRAYTPLNTIKIWWKRDCSQSTLQITGHVYWSFPNGMKQSIWFSNWNNSGFPHVNDRHPWNMLTINDFQNILQVLFDNQSHVITSWSKNSRRFSASESSIPSYDGTSMRGGSSGYVLT